MYSLSMKKKVIKKYKQLEKELFDIYESLNDNISNYDMANIRREILIKTAQIDILEEILGDEHLKLKGENYEQRNMRFL